MEPQKALGRLSLLRDCLSCPLVPTFTCWAKGTLLAQHRDTALSWGALDMSCGALEQGFSVPRGQFIRGMTSVGLKPMKPIPAPKDDCKLPQPYPALSGSPKEGGNIAHAASLDRPLPVLGVGPSTGQWLSLSPTDDPPEPAPHPECLLTHLGADFLQVVGVVGAPGKKGLVSWRLLGADRRSGVQCRPPAAGEECKAMPEAAATVHSDHLHAA